MADEMERERRARPKPEPRVAATQLSAYENGVKLFDEPEIYELIVNLKPVRQSMLWDKAVLIAQCLASLSHGRRIKSFGPANPGMNGHE